MPKKPIGPHQYGDAPVEPEYRAQMEAIIRTVDEFVNGENKGQNRETAVVLMMFKFGDNPGRCNYMSNGVSRKDMIVLMKEMTARFEGQPEIIGRNQ